MILIVFFCPTKCWWRLMSVKISTKHSFRMCSIFTSWSRYTSDNAKSICHSKVKTKVNLNNTMFRRTFSKIPFPQSAYLPSLLSVVILVIFLCSVEGWYRFYICINLLPLWTALQCVYSFLRNPLLFFINIKNCRSVLPAPTLAIRSMHPRPLNKYIFIRYDVRIILNEDRLGWIFNLSVGWILLLTTAVPHNCTNDSFHDRVLVLWGPKSSES